MLNELVLNLHNLFHQTQVITESKAVLVIEVMGTDSPEELGGLIVNV